MNPERYQKRMTFSKEGRLKYIGHLDLLRVFQRAMNRCGIDLVYSQGYNPHPQMSFAQPLSLGMTGKREYMELQLASEWDNEHLIRTLNQELPEGLHMLECADMPAGTKSAMALVTHALYEIILPQEEEFPYDQWLKDFINLPEITILRLAKYHGRKQEITVNIRPLIESLELVKPYTLKLWCVCSNVQNVKPDRMMQAFWEWAGQPQRAGEEEICRIDMFRQEGERRLNLMELLTEL